MVRPGVLEGLCDQPLGLGFRVLKQTPNEDGYYFFKPSFTNLIERPPYIRLRSIAYFAQEPQWRFVQEMRLLHLRV